MTREEIISRIWMLEFMYMEHFLEWNDIVAGEKAHR